MVSAYSIPSLLSFSLSLPLPLSLPFSCSVLLLTCLGGMRACVHACVHFYSRRCAMQQVLGALWGGACVLRGGRGVGCIAGLRRGNERDCAQARAPRHAHRNAVRPQAEARRQAHASGAGCRPKIRTHARRPLRRKVGGYAQERGRAWPTSRCRGKRRLFGALQDRAWRRYVA